MSDPLVYYKVQRGEDGNLRRVRIERHTKPDYMFQFVAGHDVHGRHFLDAEFIDGRKVEIDLSRTYTLTQLIKLLEVGDG